VICPSDLTDVTYSIARKTYFNFGDKRKHFVMIMTEIDVFRENLRCTSEFKIYRARRNIFGSPSILILLFRRLTSATLKVESKNSKRSDS